MADSNLGPEWNISSEGFTLITNNGTIKERSKILQTALDADLKDIGSSVLNQYITRDKLPKLVVQIQKIRNISAPKANEYSQTAPRMLKLVVTDGVSIAQALETTSIGVLNADKTPPGSKLLINGAKVVSGFILLNPNNCSLLGGKVPSLIEKWEVYKSAKTRSSSGTDGPPAWVNFGKAIKSAQPDRTNSKDAEVKQIKPNNTEFELQRKDAITEAASGAIRKVFGGGAKQNVETAYKKKFEEREKPFGRNNRGKSLRDMDVEETPQKPSEKVSLFAFLQDKLPPAVEETSKGYKPEQYSNSSNYHPNQQKYSYNNNQQQFRQSSNDRADYYHRRDRPKQDEPMRNKSSNVNYNKSEREQSYRPATATTSSSYSARPPTSHSDVNNALTNDLTKLSINNQFASRSLRQHLNLDTTTTRKHDRDLSNNFNGNIPGKNKGVNDDRTRARERFRAEESGDVSHEPSSATWSVGDECMAKYWEDGKFYNATITAVTEKTNVVKFKGYGNIEEVLKTDCQQLGKKPNKYPQKKFAHPNKSSYTGSMEFRRSGASFKNANFNNTNNS